MIKLEGLGFKRYALNVAIIDKQPDIKGVLTFNSIKYIVGRIVITLPALDLRLYDLKEALSQAFNVDVTKITTASKVDGFTDGCVVKDTPNLLQEAEVTCKNFFKSLSGNVLIITTASQEGKNIKNNKHCL